MIALISQQARAENTITYAVQEKDSLIQLDYSILDAKDVVGYVVAYAYDPGVLQPINESIPNDAIFQGYSNTFPIARSGLYQGNQSAFFSVVLGKDAIGGYSKTFTGSGKLGSLVFKRLQNTDTVLTSQQLGVRHSNGSDDYFTLNVPIYSNESSATLTTTSTTTSTTILRKSRDSPTTFERGLSYPTSTTSPPEQSPPKILVFPPQCPIQEQTDCPFSERAFFQGMIFMAMIVVSFLAFLIIRKFDKKRGGAKS